MEKKLNDMIEKIFSAIELETKIRLMPDEKSAIIKKINSINASNFKEYDIQELFQAVIDILSKEILNKKTIEVGIYDLLNQDFKIFDHSIKYKKAYLLADSRNRIVDQEFTKFKWKYVPLVLMGQGTINTTIDIENIMSIKIYKPYIPYSAQYMDTPSKQISILIEEFAGQSFILGSGRRAHWILSYDSIVSNRLSLKTFESNEGLFEFYKPINILDSFTISYGNPDKLILFNPDRSDITIIPGFPTRLIMNNNFYALTDIPIIYIEGFTTTDEKKDSVIISQMNNTVPFLGTVISSTEITINIDTSGLIGTPTGSPVAYYEDRRIIQAFEIIYEPKPEN